MNLASVPMFLICRQHAAEQSSAATFVQLVWVQCSMHGPCLGSLLREI